MKVSYLTTTCITACALYADVIGQSSASNQILTHQPVHEQQTNRLKGLMRFTQEENNHLESTTRNPLIQRTPQSDQTAIMLKTNQDKIHALRSKLLGLISEEAKQLSSNNQSIVSIAFLAFGVILFDVLTDAIFGINSNNIVASLIGQSRETMLPGLGLFGDNFNNLAEVVLNMLTIYLYRDESPDCGERLLCESNQQAVSRGFLDSLVTYMSGFSVSFFLRQAPISQNLEAMRAGRKGFNCIELYPKCSISL